MRRRLPLLVAAALAAPLPAAAHAATPTLIPVGTFSSPTYVAAPPGDTSRVFVVEKGGTIKLIKDGGAPRTFLDVRGDVATDEEERGLLSMAFDRDYATNGRFWIDYTSNAPTRDITVQEVRRSAADPDVADPGSRRTLLAIPHGVNGNHNGGQLQVGPDGLLYVGTGDGGSQGDPSGNGQSITAAPPTTTNGTNHDPRLGKILRIAPDGGSPYAIPPGQPIQPGAQPEIFLYGVRNPWRFSFDRQTGDLVIGDVGGGLQEEVDLLRASAGGGLGANLGWQAFEGTHPTGTNANGPVTAPVLTRSHGAPDTYCSITGGYVVRDPALPELAGRYLFGDYCTGVVESADLATGSVTRLGFEVNQLSSFGEDGCGRVYVASLAGAVSRIGTSGACAAAGGGAGGGSGGGPAPAADRTAPGIRLRFARRQHALRAARLRLRASCDEPSALGVRGTLRARRATAVRTRRVRSACGPGRSVRLDVRLGPAVRRKLAAMLRGRRAATATLTVTARDAAGNIRRQTARIAVV